MSSSTSPALPPTGLRSSAAVSSRVGSTGSATSFPRWFRDGHGALAVVVYLAAILVYDHTAATHLNTVCGCALSPDPTQWMWSWVWIPYAIAHGLNPLSTHLLWAPGPFNLAAATMAPVLAIPGAPLDALFGPVAAWNLLAFSAPVLNGWAAYRLCRYLSGAPWASILAGFTYGFSGYELAHQLAHMNLIWTFAPPLLALISLRRLNGEISRRRAGGLLSVLLVIEFGISTEIFFTMICFTALALVIGWCLADSVVRRRILEVALVLAVALAVTVVVWSYYIVLSFQGPQVSKGFPALYPADLLSYLFPTNLFRLGRQFFAGLSGSFVTNDVTEQNNYLGIGLIVIFFAYAVSRRGRRDTRLVVLLTAVAFIFSLGTKLTIAGKPTIPMPYALLAKLPFFDLLTPSRLGMYVSLGTAVAAAVWIGSASGPRRRVGRWLLGLFAAALLVPNPAFTNASFNLRETNFTQPSFFTSGLYRRYLHPGEVVLPLPYAYAEDGLSMLWQADAHMSFALASGYWGPQAPGDYAANPLVPGLTLGLLPAHAAADLDALAAAHHITAVLVADGESPGYLRMLARGGWRLVVNAGGIMVYRHPGPLPAPG